MNPKLSIVVPVYNCVDYLSECIESILNQTFRDFELILVDDGSTDGSGKICDAYAAKYPESIFVSHKTNGGAASARNAGIDSARGRYIGFVDSDDIIMPEMYGHLITVMHDTQADIVSSKIFYWDKKGSAIAENRIEFDGSGYESLKRMFRWEENTSVDTKVFKREIIGETRFKEGVINEDFRFLCDIFLKRCRVVALSSGFYFYRDTPGSVTRVIRPKYFDIFTNLDYVGSVLPKNDREIQRLFNEYSLTMHIMAGVRIVRGRLNNQYRNWIRTHRRFILKNLTTLLFGKTISLRWKAKAAYCFLRLP